MKAWEPTYTPKKAIDKQLEDKTAIDPISHQFMMLASIQDGLIHISKQIEEILKGAE